MHNPVSDEISSIVEHSLEQSMKERGVVNILIAGRSGVGKSTLINAVFQGNLAETGQGRPVTQNTREIRKAGLPLTILDTRGLELAAFADTMGPLEQLVAERARDRDASRHIHLAWLCVQEDGRRVEEAEIALHAMLAKHMPVLGVITKARADNGFRSEVQQLLPRARNVVRVRALSEELDDGHALPPYNLTALVDATAEIIPEGLRLAFANAQKASVDYKKQLGHKIVVGAAAAAAAAGAVPIPFADAAVLVPIQVGMLAGISNAFGLELSKGFLTTLVVSAAGTLGATLLGRALVSNLLKLIPGAGSVVGALISGATAATMTTALGEAYILTLVRLFANTGGEPPAAEQVAAALKEQLSEQTASK